MMASPKGNIEGFSIKIINFMKYYELHNTVSLCLFFDQHQYIYIHTYICIYIYITADSTVSAFWASSVQC